MSEGDGEGYEVIEFDAEAEQLRAPPSMSSSAEDGATAIIRTSDRIAFKRCRRRWGWNSSMRGNLGPKEVQNPLWLGSGVHYAMEDYHGYNIYGHPAKAFRAYCEAHYAGAQKHLPGFSIPGAYYELLELGEGMLNYYADYWLQDRDPLRTLWVNGKPQVEVRVLVEVPFNPRSLYPHSPYSRVLYSATIDRVVENEDGEIYLLDYKTAAQMVTNHLINDPQIGAYYWLGRAVYNRPIAGFIYQQHRKTVPHPPKITAKGRISTDRRQLTTHKLYRAALVNLFGPQYEKWPSDNLDMLNELATIEDPTSDKFIRRDTIHRNEYTFETEGAKILLECEDMLNPDLPLYPNPTRECATFGCPFLHACISLDDGSDYEYELQMAMEARKPENNSWRKLLPLPTAASSQTSSPSPHPPHPQEQHPW